MNEFNNSNINDDVEKEIEVKVETENSKPGRIAIAALCLVMAFGVAMCSNNSKDISAPEIPMVTTTAETTTEVTTYISTTSSITTTTITTNVTTEETTAIETEVTESETEEPHYDSSVNEETYYEQEEPEPVYSEVEVIETEPVTEETVEETYISTESQTDNLTFVGTYQGTYYTAYPGACGGSGRRLISGGSIASRSLYNLIGYYLDGRTSVYLESDSYPCLNGWYYLDDSTAEWVTGVIDFYYDSDWECPFQYTGRLNDVRVYY